MGLMTRKDFLRRSAAAGFFISAARIYGQAVTAGEQKLRVLAVGTGGRGSGNLRSLEKTGKVIFTGLCDVSPVRLHETQETYTDIPGGDDYRVFLEKHADEFDAVCISTPDHTHAKIALDAMRLGKHVYVEKPLAHTFEECELLLAAARKHKVVTQMGNQGHPGAFRYAKLWDTGVWGDVLDVHSWTDRAGGKWWPQGMTELPPPEPTPAGFNWDAWLGPQAARPFSAAFAPFKWRGWKDYGCGAIGDMAVHNFDPAYWLLADGTLPQRVSCWVDRPSAVAYPAYSTIDFRFGPTAKCPAGFNFYWYESRILPKPPPGAHPSFQMPENGLMVAGTRATTVGGTHASTPSLVAASGQAFGAGTRALQKDCAALLKKKEGETPPWAYDHHAEWVDACRAGDPARCGSRFEYAVPLTQSLLFGCIAQFFPGETLRWDAETRTFDKPEATAMLRTPVREGWELRV